ncbi:MAG TPA: DsbA family protein [Nitriliruptoraceae bacterium]|nr:DsbA family protein [Nitriliruptoraceae bacterium]
MTTTVASTPAMQDAASTTSVEFYFDPACPFCWQTSKWFRQVARLSDVQPVWRFISLEILNEDPDDPSATSDGHAVGTQLLRVAAAAKDALGPDVVGPLYEAMGNRLWEHAPDFDGLEGKDAKWQAVGAHQQAVVAELPTILAEVGLPVELAEARDDDRFDKELRASTEEAMERTGGDVGTPILAWGDGDGPAFFGPVISTTPSDDEALRLWEAVSTLATWPSFAELKRSMRDPIDNELLRSMDAA